ncbi:hypothetical protein DL98DRAFT_656115 [Cadophora sp. DSE1049]|nr:hypothetical protein DL98DRAFT_656115 [Cadophora sp. DSE1049]
MAITRKRKSLEQEAVQSCKRTKYTDTPNPPQTPQANKKRITIRLITPSAPRKIRLRIPIPGIKARVLTPYPSPPLETDSEGDTSTHLGRILDFPVSEKEEGRSGKRDVNELLDLYFLADGFRKESLKVEALEKLEGGVWTGMATRENVRRCFEELGKEDGVRRWVVRGLLGVWTGGEELRHECGGEEDWSWVSEEMREDVLRTLREGEEEEL